MSATLAFGGVAGGEFGAAPAGTPTPEPMRATATSITYEMFDFFNVPWGEWWDIKKALYSADAPIGAECFSAEGIQEGRCSPSDPNVADVDTYPYTEWYAGIGFPTVTHPDEWVLTPYRLRATGTEVSGYTLAWPVYFPVLRTGEPAGTRSLDFTWQWNYLSDAALRSLVAQGCPSVTIDGYHSLSRIDLTTDLQESKRLFGVVATNVNEARLWWQRNVDTACGVMGSAEAAVHDWFCLMGGCQFPAGTGKYDIYNSYEWFYIPLITSMSAIVDADGTTHVTIKHVGYGTEVLLARFFHYGNASYLDSYLDSRMPQGWSGMEVAWFEDLTFSGSIRATNHDFSLNTVVQYHFQHLAHPGPDGFLNQQGDVPFWQWGPTLSDYVDLDKRLHDRSEIERVAGKTYIQSTPGHRKYGEADIYDYTPHTWDLQPFETLTIRFPTGDVVFYDPNLTPKAANPLNQYTEIRALLGLFSTLPAAFGTWDSVTNVWTVVGPATTGGPIGHPGPDGIAGTSDDQYPLAPFPQLNLGVRPIDVVIQAPWTQLYPGQPMTLTVSASVGGTPLPGATVTATVTGAGSVTPTSGPTDASGKFQTTVQGSTSGTSISVGASVSKSGHATGTANYAVRIVDALTMTMAVSSNRREMMVNEVATIRATLTSGTTGVTGALLTPSTPIPGSTFGPVLELGSGNYEFDWTAPLVTRQTFVPINVLGKAGGYLNTTGRVTILVDPNKTNILDPTQLFLLVRSPATSLNAGQTLTITVYVYTIEGYVVSGATLNIVRVGPGTVSSASDRLNGEYTFTYTAPASVPSPTGVLITITASKVGYTPGTSRLALTVLP